MLSSRPTGVSESRPAVKRLSHLVSRALRHDGVLRLLGGCGREFKVRLVVG